MAEQSTQQDEDVVAVKLRQLLAEAQILATLASRLSAKTVQEKALQKDLSATGAAHQQPSCATCRHYEE